MPRGYTRLFELVTKPCAGLMTVAQIYPITLGANIGTTITALVASMAVAGDDKAEAARQIAVVHLLFNLSGILLLYVPRPIRNVPVHLATRMAAFAAKSRRWAIGYVVFVFYGLPALVFFAGRAIFGS